MAEKKKVTIKENKGFFGVDLSKLKSTNTTAKKTVKKTKRGK